jgi:ribonuclease PH
MERHITGHVAAVSVGIVNGLTYLDLDYGEDSRAEVDFNVVGTDAGTYVELQGTAEGKPFDRAAATAMLDLADDGLTRLFAAQTEVLATVRR